VKNYKILLQRAKFNGPSSLLWTMKASYSFFFPALKTHSPSRFEPQPQSSPYSFCHACRAVTTIQKQYLKNNEALNVLCNIVLEMNLAPMFFWHESCFYSPAMLTAFPMETYLFNVLILKLTSNFAILLRKDGKRFQFNAFIRLSLKIQLCFETSIDASFFINSIWIMSICLFSQKLFIFDHPGIKIKKNTILKVTNSS